MTTDRVTEIRRRVGAGRDAVSARDERSMRALELALAFTAFAGARVTHRQAPLSFDIKRA
jgi:hypothetical protein